MFASERPPETCHALRADRLRCARQLSSHTGGPARRIWDNRYDIVRQPTNSNLPTAMTLPFDKHEIALFADVW